MQVMNLRRPGLVAVQKIMGWTPLHLAAAEGEVQLMESLIREHGCDILARSVNSWTPLHYAAAHNKVAHCSCDNLQRDQPQLLPDALLTWSCQFESYTQSAISG